MNRFHALTLSGVALALTSVVAVSSTGATTAAITTSAGDGMQAFAGDGGPATAAKLALPEGVALTTDGYVIADSGNARIRKVSGSGIITTIAGTGAPGFAGDGGPATAAQISSAGAVAVRADGSILIADAGNKRIREVTTAGTMITVAGGGPIHIFPDVGDGGPATSANLNNPGDVAVTPDGGFLIADTANARIRKVAVDGTITTVAGNGQSGFSGDGGAATAAQLFNPSGVAPTADGGFLIADSSNNRIRKVSAGGTITTVAGAGVAGFAGDGGSALAAQLQHPMGVTPTPEGGFYVADTFNGRIRFVDAAGTITTVAGGALTLGDGGAPTAAHLNYPEHLALTSDGYLIADQTGDRVRRVSSVAAKLVVRITVPAGCARSTFSAAIRTDSSFPVTLLTVRLDGHRIASRKNAALTVRIKARALRKGRHVLRADAVDTTGKKASVKRTFIRCRS